MIKAIAIIAGEPNSISSEIIFKSWRLRKQYIHKIGMARFSVVVPYQSDRKPVFSS